MKLQAYADTGLTLYAVLLNSDGQVWNGSAFVAINGANWTDYDITLTEITAGIYTANVPAITAGSYSYVAYERTGVSPATGDDQVAAGVFVWDGSAEVVQTGDAYAVVNLALPAAAAGASGGLATVDANNRVMANLAAILGTALPAESVAGRDAAAFGKLLDVATPLLTAGEAMRGTDGAYTGTPPTASTIAGAVLDEAKGAHTGHIASIPTNPYTGTPPAAADIADAVWDEAVADHATGTTFGGKLQTAVASAADIATAVWGYASRTLTSLSALVSSIAAAVWAYATRTLTSSAAETTAAVSGSTLAITARATYSATLTGLTISASWAKMWFTLKSAVSDLDTESIVQLVATNPSAGTDGLLYLNGAAGTAAQGTLTVDQAGGTVTLTLTDDATVALVAASTLVYDVKQKVGSATTVLTSGAASISYAVTEAIT